MLEFFLPLGFLASLHIYHNYFVWLVCAFVLVKSIIKADEL